MKLYHWFFVLFSLFVSGCAYNTKEVKTQLLQGPVQELAAEKTLTVPDDPVFGLGLIENRFIQTGNYQVVLAKMPGELMNEMLAYTYVWHHGVAFNVKTKKAYPVQAVYAGKTGGFSSRIPCGRYLEVFIEGLDSLDKDVYVVIGNARGDKFYDLHGRSVNFTQESYLKGEWEKVGKVGTPLKDVVGAYIGSDLQDIQNRMASWASTGRYRIVDASSDESWFLITPYQSKAGGVDIVKDVARLNPNYSLSDKALSASGGIVLSTDYVSTGISLLIAATQVPFIKEHTAGQFDMATMAERLDSESSNCSRPNILVPIPKETARKMHGG